MNKEKPRSRTNNRSATARLLANAHENSCIVWRPREGPTEFSNKQLH